MDKDKTAPEFDPFETETRSPRRGGAVLAALALLLALAVAAWNGWEWWQARNAASDEDDLRTALSRIDAGQAQLLDAQEAQSRRLAAVEQLEIQAGLARLDEAIDRAQGVAGSDRARLATLETSQGEIMARIDGLESRIAALVTRGESPRQGLDLAEVDYLLRTANERLRLFGDARGADEALALADAQLAELDDPVYLPVRQAIASARGALADTQRPDAIALTENLSRLQARIPGLPFPGEVSVASPSAATATDGSPAVETVEDPGVWARLKATFSGLVSVRRRDLGDAVISLEDKDYLRQGLWLQLESARLALLREDPEAWSTALGRAGDTLSAHFEPESPVVQRFGADLDQMADTSLETEWPDIAEPWARLRSIRQAPVASGGGAQAEARPAPQPVEADASESAPPDDGAANADAPPEEGDAPDETDDDGGPDPA